MNKTALIIFSIGLIVSIAIIFSVRSNNVATPASTSAQQKVEMKDGIQYITIEAKGGYSPKITNAKAGIPTRLIVKTNGTYDCSAALVIRALKYQQILPQNGETIIDVGMPIAGEPLQGVCSMGMYSFVVNFT